MIELGVNIDHVATIRQARATYEPDPVWAAVEAHLGGADGITIHLREDRRHIQDADVEKLHALAQIKLNLEMAATDEMIGIACRVKPQMAMLVPEGRHEVTTEGGLDIVAQEARLRDTVARLSEQGIVSSVFIDAEEAQVDAAARIGARVCEIHTGPYAHAFYTQGRDPESPPVVAELAKIRRPGEFSPERHAFQCRTRAELLQRAAGGATARHSRTAYRARDHQPRDLRRPAGRRSRNETLAA